MRQLVEDRRLERPLDTQAFETYRSLYTTRIQAFADCGALDPGMMQDAMQSPITDTVALCCSCSVAEAAAGRCHRAWVSEVLGKRGRWDVVLDGVPYGSVLTLQGLDEQQQLGEI